MSVMNDVEFTKEDFETLSHFRYQLRRFVHWSEELTRRAGITNLQYLLLLHVKGFPGRDWATVGELAERLVAKPHGTVALVTRCERLGLVERRPGRNDGRTVEVHLTRKGARLVEKLARQHRDELLRLEGLFTVPGEAQLRKGNLDQVSNRGTRL
ncbi:MAG: MarR family winged helix-turn-helix transcriptional regulator [Rhodocyclaceae bacterium]|jgi:DNA-binding MarR family transcriptional regulator|uniref:MarR family winged helix-turn-helix transcriptional regulator n=1 Tax=Sulfuricystis thermophila TaxID=2496847 RepID=UPI0024E010AE|nr:MarR family winged helix-turn-helix transcriptional regulator [Sulfuricystis thermophila]MDI6750107.1 MarR family winged helix-turn-helix transcriptional regulator [Rhodocyclaceae bacterium]